ncbi:hypothetical protein KTT_16820 [Tengunoibacter tsumagoiensis]|uniref:DUF2079 domain-containing protein n=2 Tax=Tengunoibacter tsumagoiensis TaxID=2014871 RepID=A0A401ZYB7_9CHLR|nr:hypothetical protein KTT_16820 [Tengunoibacter tsumagoiensis]
MGCVTIAVLSFCLYFISYLVAKHQTFQTNAEDFGIMNQAIWSLGHGQLLHQTICNIVFDTNCVSTQGVSRFAIHFEPILFPVALIYVLLPDPRTLLVLQTLIVGSGAFAAFWLARLRLRSELAGVGFALLYLLYPAQQQATVFDFHAVTFTASFLLFLLYFMYTRQTSWMIVFAVLAMGCKEEMPLVVGMLGLWICVFQQRLKVGLCLSGVGLLWFLLAFFVIIPHFSPTGHHLLISRYAQLGSPKHFLGTIILHPRSFLHQYVFEPEHFKYLMILFAPIGHLSFGRWWFALPFCAPWVLVLALPTLALNMLSSDPLMYSGLFQYSAELVPIILFASIEGLVLLLFIGRYLVQWGYHAGKRYQLFSFHRSVKPLPSSVARTGLLLVLLVGMTISVLRADYYFHGQMPYTLDFQWPVSSAHIQKAQTFIDLVPPNASISAQTHLVPHLSQREQIYLFPYGDTEAEYILLDISGDIYPYFQQDQYMAEIKQVWESGQYGILDADDGYLLLQHGLAPPTVAFEPDLLPTLHIGSVSVPSQSQGRHHAQAAPEAFTTDPFVQADWSDFLLYTSTSPKGLGHMSTALLPLV